MSAPKKNRSAKWQKIGLSITCGVLALIFVVMVFATAYVHNLLGNIQMEKPEDTATLSSSDLASIWTDFTIPTDPSGTGTVPTMPTVTTVNPTDPEINQSNVVNIMLLGDDRRPGEGRQRSDVMLLCCFNLKNKSVTLISFLRDTWVHIPGYGDNKLNAAYAVGGYDLLTQTLAANYGIQIDGYASTNFTQFEGLINTLGGVDITLTAKEASHLNEMHGWSLSAGTRRLTGAQALAYSRIRYIDTDYQRASRQRKVITSLMERYKTLSVTDALGMLDDVLSTVTVSRNMTTTVIMSYIRQLLPVIAAGNFRNQQIPAEGTFTTSDAHSWIELPDLAANRKILKEIMEATS